jgi:hypothetical protein
MSVAVCKRPAAEPSAGALPSTITEPSRRTSQPPFPSGRMATSTTVAGRMTGAVVVGQLDGVVSMDGSVVGVATAGPDVAVGPVVVVGLARLVVAVVGAFDAGGFPLVAVVPGAAVVVLTSVAPVVGVGSEGMASPWPRLSADTSTAGLSDCAAQPAAPKRTTSATTRFRLTSGVSGRATPDPAADRCRATDSGTLG